MKKTVVIGVTSGIASYKVLDLIRLLKKDGVDVSVIMTKRATQMVPFTEFEKTSGNKVYSELFEEGFDYKKILKRKIVDHIELADRADVMVIIPATANIIAKIAQGIADDFLTTTTLAVTAPIIICPSMNVHMWHNPLVLQNTEKLRKNGYQIINPIRGELACGYEGMGRLEDIVNVHKEILKQLTRTDSLKGKKIIVTAGGTREKIDAVRFITNKSNGKMGVSIAEESYLRGAEVLLFRAKSSVVPRYPIQQELFENANDLELLIKNHVGEADIFFQVAAISDFKSSSVTNGKLSSEKKHHIDLEPREKILNKIKAWNKELFLVGFKAEYGLTESNVLKAAKEKFKTADVDLVVANDISKPDRGFESDTNEVYIITKNESVKKIPLSSKQNIAIKIIDEVVKQIN